jgi:hypothetical protein
MEAIFSSETWVDFEGTARRYIPQDSTLHNHCCGNLNGDDSYPDSGVEDVFTDMNTYLGILGFIRDRKHVQEFPEYLLARN